MVIEDGSKIVAPVMALSDKLMLLGLAGIGGAFWRAAIAPEKEWKRRCAQGIAGALSAVFLGGVLATLLMQVFPAGGDWVWLASGFLMGSGGEVAVRAMQNKLLGAQE